MAGNGSSAPSFQSAALAAFTVGAAGTFTVQAAGATQLQVSALPTGVGFTDHGNGTAVIAGTPAPTAAGEYHLAITATGPGGSSSQQFTLAVGGSSAPAFTSAGQASFAQGTAGSFTITAPGALQLTVSGSLPDGLAFTDQGGGTAVLAGTPAADAAAATSVLTFTATNAVGMGTQSFDLTIGPPLFLSAPVAVFTTGAAGTFTVQASGDPVLRVGVPLPPGVEFTDHGGGTAVIAGTPAPTTAGAYHLAITATSGGGSSQQQFTLAISGASAPVFTSVGQASFAPGVAGSFTVAAPGALQLAVSGPLPDGLAFTDQGGGSAVLSGTPGADVAIGVGVLTFTASNTAGMTTQSFSLTIGPPLFLSAPLAVFTTGAAGTFTVQASGDPVLHVGVPLPPGVEFSDQGGGRAAIAGTPAPTAAGVYHLAIMATSAGGSSQQQFTLAISGSSAPAITSAAQASFAANSFTITAPGALQLSLSGSLPEGLAFTDQGNGTAALSGTPAAGVASGSYPLTVTASNAAGSQTQSFELTII